MTNNQGWRDFETQARDDLVGLLARHGISQEKINTLIDTLTDQQSAKSDMEVPGDIGIFGIVSYPLVLIVNGCRYGFYTSRFRRAKRGLGTASKDPQIRASIEEYKEELASSFSRPSIY